MSYRIGTISVTNGSKAVVGTNTLFATVGVSAGDQLTLVDANGLATGAMYEVVSVTDNTHLTLLQNYQGTTGSGKAYAIIDMAGDMTVANFARRLAQFYADINNGASPTVKGLVKLYAALGSNTDGSLTQAALQTLFNGKVSIVNECIPMFNTRVFLTSSQTFTAPVTGWYKITAKGGGGGGGGGSYDASSAFYTGGGGGEGGTYIGYHKLNAGQSIPCVVGAGGNGGEKQPVSGGSSNLGTDGGSSYVTINGVVYAGAGGKPGGGATVSYYADAGAGGSGRVCGCSGASGVQMRSAFQGGSGGGTGGSTATNRSVYNATDNSGGGGSGGKAYSTITYTFNGGKGGSGFISFEYFNPTL